MAWKGPSGLLGEPETDRENYSAFPVVLHEGITAFVHGDVLAHMERTPPTAEGDYLFFVEGFGRLRFRFVPIEEPDC
jgi:hypothetical protein